MPEPRSALLRAEHASPTGQEEHPSRCARSWGSLDGVTVGCPSWARF